MAPSRYPFGLGCRRISEHMPTPRDARSAHASAYRRWYKLAVWLKLRAQRLAQEPLCRMCLKEGRYTPATTVDHIEPHRGSWALFATYHNTQSLCPSHHSSAKQQIEKHGYSNSIGQDGWPIDER